ncbi:helix-turn-helix domain-containing protein [Gottfriedia sp. NPDC056225]|uniref:helix-turn-helix domain-containing protein n=1 Tax=Gottfriedia sp. NPDC056225 TaxID=3345751 RepID=UPI0035D58110
MKEVLLYTFTKLMKDKNWKLKDLAIKSEIHKTEISQIFNSKKVLSLHNLDAITKAFELPEGSFYNDYVKLCFNERNLLDKRRSSAFIYQCANNGFNSALSNILSIINNEESVAIRTKYFQNVFFIAEKLFLEGKEEVAIPLYEFIIEHMSNSITEEVAISYFRKFYWTRLTSEGNIVLERVLEYISYMPTKFQELTILWITATYYSLKQWDEVLSFAKRLEKMTKSKDHLGRALMYQAFALTRLGGSLKEVLNLINKYEGISDYYADLAVGNRYVARIDFGDFHVVDSYYRWIRNRDDVHVGIPRIIECYVKLGRLEDAEMFIEKFHDRIDELSNSSNLQMKHLYLDYQYAIGLLKCKTKRYYEGLEALLNVASKVKSDKIQGDFQKCLRTIWDYRKFLNKELEETYIRALS